MAQIKLILMIAVLTLILCQIGTAFNFAQSNNWSPDDYSRLLQRLDEGMQRRTRGGYYGHQRDPLKPQQELRWKPTIYLGEVVGVAVNGFGDPVILHRGGRVWEPRSFNETHQMVDNSKLPINCVVVLDKYSAQAKDLWGSNTFLMPHGITIDIDGHVWVTDVGLHQVVKFSGANHHPLLTLGEAEVPGSDKDHFCQPTSTAVTLQGEVFVADGYCNNRIMRFSVDGAYMGQFGTTGSTPSGTGVGALHLPHGIALDEYMDALCVADREGRRIVCYSAGIYNPDTFGRFISVVPEIRDRRVFDVASLGSGILMAVGGSAAEGSDGVAFTADFTDGSVLNLWGPREGLHNPHAVAVAPDGSAIYVAEMAPNTLWKFTLSSY